MSTTSLEDHIAIGRSLQWLLTADSASNAILRDEMEKFFERLDRCNLPYTKAAALPMRNATFYFDPRTGGLTAASANTLRLFMQGVENCLADEANRSMLALNVTGVSRKLIDLPTATDSQRRLKLETVRCLECEACRAAAVMGWCMAFDIVRAWVLDNRRDEFEARLRVQCADKYPDGIGDEEQFCHRPRIGEGRFLDVCDHGNVITGNPMTQLRDQLRKRNEYAHPTGLDPTLSQANSYIEDLIDLVSHPPFVSTLSGAEP